MNVLTSTFSFLVLVATWKVPCEATMRQSSKMKQPPNMVAMLCESSQPGNSSYVFVQTLQVLARTDFSFLSASSFEASLSFQCNSFKHSIDSVQIYTGIAAKLYLFCSVIRGYTNCYQE